MTHEIQWMFRELLNQSSWLDSMTKHVAGEKVEAMQLRIGYPDFILDDRQLDDRYRDVRLGLEYASKRSFSLILCIHLKEKETHLD